MLRKQKSILVLFAVTLLIPSYVFAQMHKEDIWEPFRYFEGSWTGLETSRAGEGKGERTYEFIMNGTYLYSRNLSRFKPQEQNPEGEVHEDWTFFSFDKNRNVYVIREFTIEGFVNTFVLDSLSGDKKSFVFTSESSESAPPGVRVRLTYEIRSKNEFVETYELAMPGGEYSAWLRNYWKRKTN